jgi:hypothetical protein
LVEHGKIQVKIWVGALVCIYVTDVVKMFLRILMNMNTKRIINEMDEWLENSYPGVIAKKVDGDNFASMSDIEDGSYTQAEHLKWMIGEMRSMDDREKLMRWIGFIQGALWGLGFSSINNFRSMNLG